MRVHYSSADKTKKIRTSLPVEAPTLPNLMRRNDNILKTPQRKFLKLSNLGLTRNNEIRKIVNFAFEYVNNGLFFI